MVSRHWLYFGGFVVTGVLTLGAGLLGILEGLSALSGNVPRTQVGLVVTMLGAAAEWVVVVLVLGAIAALFLTATAVSLLRRASLPRDDRLASLVERLEGRYPMLRRFGASEKVEPTTADRKAELKEQYVEGDMSESEFEREMSQLLDEESAESEVGAETSSGSDSRAG